MRKKSLRKYIALLTAFVFILGSVGMAFADTVYVGNVGFDMDKMVNDDTYNEGFNDYFATHTNDPFIVDMAGMTFDVAAYLNAPDGTSMPDFAASDPAEVPAEAIVWDGEGEPGEPVEKLTVENVEAINANQISVKFEGMEEAVTIDLDEALVEGENEITFTYKDQEFTTTVTYEAPTGLAVKSVSAIENITVTVGDDVVLPETVTVTYDDESTAAVAVVWNAEEFDFTVAGTSVLTGTIEGTELTAAVTVVVEEAALVVESVSAINANTISVTFEGMEPVEVTLETALVHGQTEVTFSYEEVEYTGILDEAYADPEVVEEEIAEAVDAAIAKINAIDNPATLTLEDEAKVVAARTAVDAAIELGAVDADIVNLDHLIAAEAKIKSLKDELDAKETAIQDANVALTNLPLAANITLEDKEQVEAARVLVDEAFNLGAEESDLINLWKLTDAEAKIAELEGEATDAEAVQAVEDAIAALPVEAELTLADKDAVVAARAAYDALTEAQQALVPNVNVLEAAEAKITALEEAAAKEITVKSVSAINAKTLKVTFNNAVAKEDQAKATFDVKRGTIATAVEATWAEDGKSVELARATNLLAGTYTVTVGGLEFAEGKNAGTVEVTAQKIAKLEIVTENVIKSATAEVVFTAKDQYGEKMDKTRGDFTWTVVNVTDSTRAVTVAGAVGDKVLKLNTLAANVDDVIRITGLLASDPSVKAVKEVTVSNIFVDSFELGEVVLPKDATMLVQNAGYVEVKYSAKDNFGKEVTLSDVAATANNDTVDGIQFITSDNTIIPTKDSANNFKVTDGKLEVKVLNVAGDVTLTALNTNSGATSSIKIKVNATAAPATVEFGEFKDGAEIVAGDTDKTAKLGITFFDQYGEAIKNDTYDMTGNFNVTVTGAGTLNVENALVDGYVVFKDSAATAGTYTITLVHKTTGASVSTQVTVNKARVPSELKVKTSPDVSIAKSGSTSVEFEVKDQYGKDVAFASLGSYSIKAASKNTKVTITSPLTSYTAAINGSAEGADVVTFTLEDASNVVIDSVSFNIDVVDDLATLDVTTDKTEYTAGNDITVTIKAEKAGNVAHTTFEQSGVATVTVGSKSYIRNITFVKGVATTTVPATTAGASVAVNATFAAKTDASAPNVKVVEAAASKFVLANNTADLDITLQDDFGNIITALAGDKVVKVTYPAAADITGSGIDAEGNAVVTFANGAGSITFADAALVGGTYTVTFEGYTGTLKVK